jgi:hypothetical protein
MNSLSNTTCKRCNKTYDALKIEYKIKDCGLLGFLASHNKHCDGTHWDKVLEAYRKHNGDATIRKRGHKQGNVWENMTVDEAIKIKMDWMSDITLDNKLCNDLYNYAKRRGHI